MRIAEDSRGLCDNERGKNRVFNQKTRSLSDRSQAVCTREVKLCIIKLESDLKSFFWQGPNP